MGAPKKNELDKSYKLSGITIPNRKWNYIINIANIRGISPKEVLIDAINEYQERHIYQFVLDNEKNDIRTKAKKYRENSASYNKRLEEAHNHILEYIMNNLNRKWTIEDKNRTTEQFLKKLERDMDLEKDVIEKMYSEECDRLVKVRDNDI
jgi:hypothetical protein